MSDEKKRKKKFRRLFLAILIAIFCFILAIFIIKAPNGRLEVTFLDIGQGDASLIKTPDGTVILMDGGPDNKVLQVLGKNLPFYRRRLDFLIISHYHDDHIIGLIEAIKRYRVKTILYSGKEPDNLNISELLQVAAEYKVDLQPIDSQISLSFGNACQLDLLNPESFGIKNDPNNSVMAELRCLDHKFLFSGDNEGFVEPVLIKSGILDEVDVFKASHHGSNYSNSLDFLKKISPELIVVSAGADNRFGHPGRNFLDRAASLNIPVKRTDQDGQIKLMFE